MTAGHVARGRQRSRPFGLPSQVTVSLLGLAFLTASPSAASAHRRPPLPHWHRRRPRAAGRQFHAVEDREDTGQAGERRTPHCMLRRRGQYKATSACAGPDSALAVTRSSRCSW